jgi:hypothetical protein
MCGGRKQIKTRAHFFVQPYFLKKMSTDQIMHTATQNIHTPMKQYTISFSVKIFITQCLCPWILHTINVLAEPLQHTTTLLDYQNWPSSPLFYALRSSQQNIIIPAKYQLNPLPVYLSFKLLMTAWCLPSSLHNSPRYLFWCPSLCCSLRRKLLVSIPY